MTKTVIDACILLPFADKKLRVVVKKDHDYYFKNEGRVIATVTKKLVRVDGCTDATGDQAKQLWKYVREALGHIETESSGL